MTVYIFLISSKQEKTYSCQECQQIEKNNKARKVCWRSKEINLGETINDKLREDHKEKCESWTLRKSDSQLKKNNLENWD